MEKRSDYDGHLKDIILRKDFIYILNYKENMTMI